MLIYMPMIPETAITMLSCARIGAIHSLVFGGFASNELASRIKHAQVTKFMLIFGAALILTEFSFMADCLSSWWIPCWYVCGGGGLLAVHLWYLPLSSVLTCSLLYCLNWWPCMLTCLSCSQRWWSVPTAVWSRTGWCHTNRCWMLRWKAANFSLMSVLSSTDLRLRKYSFLWLFFKKMSNERNLESVFVASYLSK